MIPDGSYPPPLFCYVCGEKLGIVINTGPLAQIRVIPCRCQPEADAPPASVTVCWDVVGSTRRTPTVYTPGDKRAEVEAMMGRAVHTVPISPPMKPEHPEVDPRLQRRLVAELEAVLERREEERKARLEALMESTASWAELRRLVKTKRKDTP
jgi:hypothetical protein